MMNTHLTVKTLAEESKFDVVTAEILDKMFAFFASNTFRIILIVLGIALFLFILTRIYLRLRTSHLGNIEYERTFSRDGIYK